MQKGETIVGDLYYGLDYGLDYGFLEELSLTAANLAAVVTWQG